MHLGIARLQLEIGHAQSLKDKRAVLRSVVRRVRNQFNVAIAEVDTHDNWRMATLGIVCVSADQRHANEMLDRVVDFIESERLDAQVGGVEIEMLAV